MRPWPLLLTGGLIYAAAVVWAATSLPSDSIPLHFDAAGAPDRFASRGEALATFIGIGLVMFGIGAGGIWFAHRSSLTFVNIPHKDYWTAPERRARLRQMLALDIALLMAATLALLGLIPLATVRALRSDPVGLPPVVLWSVLGLFLAAVAAWSIWLVKYRYRPRGSQ